MKISSDTISANDAVSKIVDANNQSLTNQQATLGFSNVSSMQSLVKVSNQLIGDMSKLISCVYTQAEKVQKLAAKKEQDDAADADSLFN